MGRIQIVAPSSRAGVRPSPLSRLLFSNSAALSIKLNGMRWLPRARPLRIPSNGRAGGRPASRWCWSAGATFFLTQRRRLQTNWQGSQPSVRLICPRAAGRGRSVRSSPSDELGPRSELESRISPRPQRLAARPPPLEPTGPAAGRPAQATGSSHARWPCQLRRANLPNAAILYCRFGFA
jgi:hypothetical protein